ncbi:hypothetical protein AB0J84_31855, partial [Micromonospora arborensis]|uniref:hypothetical protein n=1 Tax=Micromonospora arborensis TaxID=2116518 RepID=UPI00343DE2A7
MATDYATVRITPESRAALDRFLFQLTGQVQRRVTLSDAITAACAVASAHLPEAGEAINPPRSG